MESPGPGKIQAQEKLCKRQCDGTRGAHPEERPQPRASSATLGVKSGAVQLQTIARVYTKASSGSSRLPKTDPKPFRRSNSVQNIEQFRHEAKKKKKSRFPHRPAWGFSGQLCPTLGSPDLKSATHAPSPAWVPPRTPSGCGLSDQSLPGIFLTSRSLSRAGSCKRAPKQTNRPKHFLSRQGRSPSHWQLLHTWLRGSGLALLQTGAEPYCLTLQTVPRLFQRERIRDLRSFKAK